MPRLRKAVDQSTGEVYHIETTREAKRRHKRDGGAQFKPTAGQINAADIWNKQEEKIRRDREREEKRKRVKLRQEEKDARLRELQEEKLRAGRISIEDTWGKVNASQNRLHKFFIPHKSLVESEPSDRHELTLNTPSPTVTQQHVPCQDLDEFFTNSPLSPESMNKLATSSDLPATVLLSETKPVSISADHNLLKRTAPSPSQTMMPPPKRPPISRIRSPLGEMTTSEINIRANERPNPTNETDYLENTCMIGTQAVKDVLSGLCSQDFEDDFTEGEEKENRSPEKSAASCGTKKQANVSVSEAYHTVIHKRNALQYEMNAGDFDDANDDADVEEFDDDGIDDESLLSLAATQRLRQEFLSSSKRIHESTLSSGYRASTTDQSVLINPNLQQTPSFPKEAKASDSFAMENLDDEDLIQGLENYESEITQLDSIDNIQATASHSFTSEEHAHQSPKKAGRVLPWIKNPLSFICGDQGEDELPATSPLSPWDAD